MGWTRPQLLMALRLYMRLPFGRLHGTNPEVVGMASAIGRTPGAMAMKACNFASLDPLFRETGRKGLSGASEADRQVWAEFTANPEAVAAEAELTFEELTGANVQRSLEPPESATPPGLEQREVNTVSEFDLPKWGGGETDVLRTVRARRVQGFFRAAVLTSYDGRCAITGLAVPELLVASHVIPWAESVERRADPTNGICLSALFDRAFDRGLVTLDEDYRVVVSQRLKDAALSADLGCSLAEADGRAIRMPGRFGLDPAAVERHRVGVFRG